MATTQGTTAGAAGRRRLALVLLALLLALAGAGALGPEDAAAGKNGGQDLGGGGDAG